MNNTPAEAPSPQPPAAAVSPDVPGFAASLAGLWTLNWRAGFTWRRAPVWLAVLVANPLLAWVSIPRGGTQAFLDWTTHLYLELLVPLYCLVTAGGMIRDEVQDDTLCFALTRPLTRARLYIGKYLCQLATLELAALFNGGLLVLAGVLCGVQPALSLAGRLLLAGALAVLVYAALGGLFGLMTRRYIVLGLVYGFIVEVGIGHIPTNINSLSMMRHVRTLMAGHAAVHDRYDWSPDGALTGVLIMLGTAAAAIVAGALVFTWNEYLASHEAPK
jgi:ABC-type transport system involved in multi-copper enzyme maturation permease subunit